jgi:putative heme-binding domain-containing protein
MTTSARHLAWLAAWLLFPASLLAQAKTWTIPADSDFEPARLKVPEGFSIEVAAPPPLVAHPTMACFDDRGRLFVAENAGVNLSAAELEEQLPNSVRMLEDTNGDGFFDKATLFADKMTFPMGGAWHDGALFVASPPNIWRLEDTTGDGVADKRDILVNKFGYTGNAASVHGCFAGPDGRIYWCDGRHGHEFRDKDGNVTSKRAGSYIFSCESDGSDVRIHCGGGMDNPVEVDFTEEGEILGTVNIFYTRPRADCLVHWLHGGAYPHYEKVLGEFQRTGDLLGPVHNFGHVAISGTMRYRSDSFGKEFQNNFFATFFNGGKVVRVELERKGASFSATQREFLAAEGNNFHPTDVLEDADGSVLVVDTGGWFYRGCPTSQIARPEIPGAIYRIRRDAAKPAIDPRGLEIDWRKLSEAALAGLLGDERPAVAERAIAECARRGQVTVPFSVFHQNGSPRAKRNALWATTRIRGTIASQLRNGESVSQGSTPEVIRAGLADGSASVRQTACRSVATHPDVAFLPILKERLRDDEAGIRREAAKALGRIGNEEAIPSLVDALGRSGGIDRSEEHAIIFALIEIDEGLATADGLKSDSPSTIRGILLALDQMPDGNLSADRIAPHLNSLDAKLRHTAVGLLKKQPDGGQWAARQMGRWFRSGKVLKHDTLEELAAVFADEQHVAGEIGNLLSRQELPQIRKGLFDALASRSSLPLHENWVKPIREQLNSKTDVNIELGLSVVSAIQTDRFNAQLTTISQDESRSKLLRVAALEAASGRDARLSEPAFALLTGLLSGNATAVESARAAQLLGGAALTPPQLVELAPHLSLAGPIQIRDLIQPFLRDRRPEVAVAFLDAMDEARSLLTLPVPLFSDVVKRYPDEFRDRANSLLDQVKAEEARQVEQVDRLLPLLKTGDAKNGRVVFFGKKSKCATCHRVGKEGDRIGPDLTTIGANRSPADLLESIVLPSATIVREYDPYLVVTKKGRVVSGLIVRDTKEAVHIQPQTGEPVIVPRSQVESVTPATVSIMPKGLEQALTEKELADVVAFLKSLK